MLLKCVMENVIARALSTGGDYVELFLEDSSNNMITMADSKIRSALSGRDHGASIRIFKGMNCYYGYTTDLSENGLLYLADQIASTIGIKTSVTFQGLVEKEFIDCNPSIILPTKLSNRIKADAVELAYAGAVNFHPACKNTTVIYRDQEQDVTIATSEGYYSSDKRIYTRLTTSVLANAGMEVQSGEIDFMGSNGFEIIKNQDPREFGIEAAKRAMINLGAKPCISGEMPVVFSPEAGGTLLHEACGHPLEANAIAQGDTIYAKSLGEKIASEKVTILDDGILPGDWGTTNIDDEGVPSQSTLLVEKGICKGFMVDRFNGRRINMKPTGNGRKQGYRYLPTSRMHETYIANGTDKVEDVFDGIKEGLYVKSIGGGSANNKTGEFTVSSVLANIIRNGKVCEPVRTGIIMGNSMDTMFGIDMVADDLLYSYGNCGASSGNLPVGNGTPHIRVKKMKIASRN